MDQKIKHFWQQRADSDRFLWNNLAGLNVAFTNRYLQPQTKVLDLGCGDGSSVRNLKHSVSLTLVDYVRSKHLQIPENAIFIQQDLRTFQPTEQFDLITFYGVANSFDHQEVAKLYFNCFKWLKPDGVLLVKHQCGKCEDVMVDKFSTELNSDYCAYYYSVERHQELLQRSGFEVEIDDPYPLSMNKWTDTVFKAFICRKSSIIPYSTFFGQERMSDTVEWFAMHHRRESVGDVRNSEHKWFLLQTVKQYLDRLQIPFYLMFGTLLGALREGDFISWDGDVDIAILGRFQSRLMSQLDIFQPLQLLRIGDYYCSFVHQDEFLDIYTYTEGEKYSYCHGAKPFFDEELEVFESPSTISFRGVDFLSVNKPLVALERWYGSDWRQPVKNFWELRNGMIIPNSED